MARSIARRADSWASKFGKYKNAILLRDYFSELSYYLWSGWLTGCKTTFFLTKTTPDFLWKLGLLCLCGRGGTVDATDLIELSALRETGDAELLKFGETSHVAIPSQARERGKV
jgi:hypothetical protein